MQDEALKRNKETIQTCIKSNIKIDILKRHTRVNAENVEISHHMNNSFLSIEVDSQFQKPQGRVTSVSHQPYS